MIRPLRVAHGVAWLTMAIILPVVISAALIARHLAPPEPNAPTISGTKQSSTRGTFFLRREGNTLVIGAARAVEYPDVLVYWSPDSHSISEKSKLLGPFISGSLDRYTIPPGPGVVVLYSAAKEQVIDSAPLGGSQ